MRETSRHQRAFETFYAMGPDRTLAAVAKREGVSLASVKLWSRTFGWTHRVAERDESVASVVQRESVRTEVDRRTRNRKIVEASIIKTARAIADGEVRPTFQSLEGLIRLEEQLMGEADARELLERDLRSKTPAELQMMLREELRELISLVGKDVVRELLEEPELH